MEILYANDARSEAFRLATLMERKLEDHRKRGKIAVAFPPQALYCKFWQGSEPTNTTLQEKAAEIAKRYLEICFPAEEDVQHRPMLHQLYFQRHRR